MNGKKLIIFFLFFLILFSCGTFKTKEKNKVVEKTDFYKEGLNFEIPLGMIDSTTDAKKFNLRNFIIEKNRTYNESKIIIAIREVQNLNDISLEEFTKLDIIRVKQYYKLKFFNNWQPIPLIKKGIELIAFFFSYSSADSLIYQKSVYIKFKKKFYVISLMSKTISNLENNESIFFWNSVFIYNRE